MAYNEELAERIRDLVSGEPIEEKGMFGGLAFLLGGHMAVSASGQGGLLVRCEPGLTETLLAEPGAGPMEMGGRGPVEGWVRLSAAAVADDDVLEPWVDRGLDYARSLPPK
jgi:hypothetical protein